MKEAVGVVLHVGSSGVEDPHLVAYGQVSRAQILHAAISWRSWLIIALSVCAFVFATTLALGETDMIRAGRSAVSLTSLAVLAFVSTPLWRLAWLLPPMQKRAPLLDGRWAGVQTSNWPVLAALKDAAKGSGPAIDVDNTASALPTLSETPVEADITTSFFHIRMAMMTSQTGYMDSELKAAVLEPADDKRPAKLAYLFEGRVKTPLSTDTDRFDGAAEVDVRLREDQPLLLSGRMWTNRNWTRGLNTAGHISLTRKEDWSMRSLSPKHLLRKLMKRH